MTQSSTQQNPDLRNRNGDPTSVTIPIQRLAHGHGLPLPDYASLGAAGIDLAAAIDDAMILRPLQRILIPSGFALGLPAGFEAQIRPRSGLAAKYGITVLNSPGTIDSDYIGEIKILLINLGESDHKITRGDRIAQMVIQAVCRVEFSEMDALPRTERGSQGFGSTGFSGKISAAVKPAPSEKKSEIYP
ncbi:MAG: dUTP diphosphatase [Alphaproteobacteria bacterium]|nr:dUTP diphosphatase [Alphaproteobacteria bacterium]